MRKYIIASHGGLATGMKSAVEMIIGTCGNIECYDLNTYSTPQKIYDVILAEIEKNESYEYIIFADIPGGSVYNQLMHLCKFNNVYLVGGVNLGMALEVIINEEEENTKNLILDAINEAVNSIVLIDNEFMKEKRNNDKEETLW